MTDRATLFDVHHSLSHLVFAVRENLKPLWVTVTAEWHEITYLTVAVECRGKDVQMVADRLVHGVLQGEYDYRFRSVSKPVGIGPDTWTIVRASPDMQHDQRRSRTSADHTQETNYHGDTAERTR